MRTLQKNKQNLKYALLDKEIPIFKKDENGKIMYIEMDGEKIPIETGETEKIYSLPVEFRANIATSGGESKMVEYGIDKGDYDAILVVERNLLPITETSLIWCESKVGYKDVHRKIIDGNSADYYVKKLSPSLNQMKYLLKKIVK